MLAGAVLVLAAHWTYERAESYLIAERQAAGASRLALYEELLRGWLGKYRALPSIYAHEPDIVALIETPDDPARVAAANAKLERWSATSGASDTYVLNAEGTAIAASNWNSDATFIGKSYWFRPYFRQAMQGRLGRTFALGTVSGLRGYYFAYPVQVAGRIAGAVVVKIGVGTIEQELRLDRGAVFVTDRNGIVLLAGPPDWRMTVLEPLSPEAEERVLSERLFPTAALSPIPVAGLADAAGGGIVEAQPDRSGTREARFLHLSRDMSTEEWRVHLLVETDGIRRQSLLAALFAALALVTLFLIGFVWWQRRRRTMNLLAARAATQRELERQVSERTANLREANEQLAREVSERTQAEEDLRRTQSELIQAGKLAALGQMSAALSHEFNQPLAAIRTYSDNAAAFIERGRTDRAEENLARISRLTERMARLSRHLTSFSRKPKDTVEAVALDKVLSESLSLLHARIESAEARIDNRVAPGLLVMGGQTRLQHVFMNLIGNALDAMAGQDAAVVTLRSEAAENAVRIIVEDAGPGIAPEVIGSIFDPFFSTKEPGRGLGLGLSISFNIVRDFDGHLEAENRAEGGARFTVTLRSAAAQREAAE